MPVIDENRLKGNYAASYVAARLSTNCLVRPVAVDTDVGIDLYCETVQENRPFLHFWLQVKSGSQCMLASNGSSASCRFDKEHLQYWSRQPVPVFAALVPVEWPVKDDPTIYVVPLTTFPSGRGQARRNTAMLPSQFALRPGNQDDLLHFLGNIVPEATAQLECKKGLVASIPQLFPQYVVSYPPVPVWQFGKQILNQIRTTAAVSVLLLHQQGRLCGVDAAFRRLLVRVVEEFADEPHWENPMAQALSYHADGDYRLALEFYREAKRRIEQDPNVASLPEWQGQAKQIEALMGQADRKEPVANR
jgi:hypothetical protein